MRFFLFLLGIVICAVRGSYAQPIINITHQHNNADVRSSMWIYESPIDECLSIKEIRLLPTTQFKPITKPVGGFLPQNIWIKFIVNNQSGEEVFLDIVPSIADTIKLYCVKSDGSLVESHTGLSYPFKDRGLRHTNQNIKLQGDHNTNQIYYLYINNHFPVNYKFRLTPYSQLEAIYHTDSLIGGLLFGMMISFVLISIVIYAALRKPSYLWYGLYLTSLLFLLSYYYGYFQLVIFPNAPEYNSMMRVLVNFPTMLGLIFQAHFLRLRRHLPFYSKVIFIIVMICLGNIFIGFLGYLDTSVFVSHILSLPSVLFCLVLGIRLYRGKNHSLLLLILGSIVLSITLLLYLVDNLLIEGSLMNIKYIIHSGMLIQAFLITLAMGQQVRAVLSQKNKNKALYIDLLRTNKEIIQQQNQELELRIQERTKELQGSLEREREKEIKLRKSNKELTEFAHIVSHDLKAPLRNITAFIQLMLRRSSNKFDTTDKEYMDYIINSAKQGTQLVEDLLNYSKLDKNIGDPLLIDINDIISNIIINNSNVLKDRKAEIFSNTLPTINAHKSLITLLWQNIILNGIKYNSSKTPVIELGYFTKEHNIVFWVRDNGIGIPPQYQEEVFRMFSRLHTSDKYEGTGIGLAFCKRIVDFYEGKIWFESIEGEGTTFFFTLPKASFQGAISTTLTPRAMAV